MSELFTWKIFTVEESLRTPMSVAIECPHCGSVIKISKDTVNDYLNAGARLIQFRCIEPDCDSNTKYAEDIDVPLLDLRSDVAIAWADDGTELLPLVKNDEDYEY